MLTKEEYEELVDKLHYASWQNKDMIIAFKILIKEHFELAEEHEKLKRMLKTFK